MQEKSFTVFVIDDDDSIQRALERLLRSEGYHVVTFGSAEDFLHSGVVRGESCLVLDIRLPGMSGLDLQDRLALNGKKQAIIFITAHDNPQWQERAKTAGAVAYLRKPFDQQSLLDAVRHCRHQRKGDNNELTAR
jgi:FixJ family two-component response regulator